MKIIRLTIYNPTHVRLSKALLPAGMNLTRWINQAMCEKLDRDCPDTIGVLPPPPPEPERQPIDPQAILADMRKRDAAKHRPDFGPFCVLYPKGTTEYAVALGNHKRNGVDSLGIEGELEAFMTKDPQYALTDEQKRDIMAEYERKLAALPPVPPHMFGNARKIAAWREAGSPVEAPAQEEQAQEYSEVAEYLAASTVKTAKLAEDEEDSFWGDDELAKVRANVKKHCQ